MRASVSKRTPLTLPDLSSETYRGPVIFAPCRRGITVRKNIDLLIGTWCIENGRPLLHNDNDFLPMVRYLGLREVPVAA